jgi:hypothetical protein
VADPNQVKINSVVLLAERDAMPVLDRAVVVEGGVENLMWH